MNERIRELAHQAAKPENRMNFVTYGKLTNEKLIEFAIQSGVHPSYLDPENPENSLTGSLNKFAELIVRECASIVYNTCQDGDAGAQAILYEFDIDNARSQK